MKQVLHPRTGGTAVREVPEPPCGPGDVLVRTHFSVISSGTERASMDAGQKSLVTRARERPDLVRKVVDRALKDGIRSTRASVQRKLAEETTSGYSCAGEVIAVGSHVRDFAPGDRVACAGAGHAHHAEIVAVPSNLCARVPDGVGFDTAAFTTIAAIALHGFRLAEVELGDRVAVIGCGLVGQIACRLVTAAGAEAFALDIDPERLEAARAAGAAHAVAVADDAAATVRALTDDLGVDRVLVCAAAPSSDPLLLAAEIARDRGTVVLVGAVPIEFPRAPLYRKELDFRVSRSYGPGRYDREYEERGLDYPIGYVRWTEQRNMEAILDLQARGQLELADLIDEIVPVDDAPAAYERLTGVPEQRPRGALVLSYPVVGVRALPPVTAAHLPLPEIVPPVPASGPVRVALLGPGGFALQVLVPALRSAGAELDLVGGGSGMSAQAAANDGIFRRVAESEEAVLNDEAIDAVIVATRHASHADLSSRALLAGKHVFCEKPLALTSEELDQALESAASSGRILAVGFNRRFSPMLREARDFVSEPGERVTAVYRVRAGQAAPGHWVHDLEQGGGRALGEVCHFIDSLAFVAGARVVAVHATGWGHPGAPIQARDNLVINLTMGDGSVAAIVYSAVGAGRIPKERLEVFSGSRAAVLDDYNALELYDGDARDARKTKSQDKGHEAELKAFVDGAQSGRPPVPLAEFANFSRATLAVVQSLQLGTIVRID